MSAYLGRKKNSYIDIVRSYRKDDKLELPVLLNNSFASLTALSWLDCSLLSSTRQFNNLSRALSDGTDGSDILKNIFSRNCDPCVLL